MSSSFFPHCSDPQHIPEGMPRPFTRCGLADSHFEPPVGQSLLGRVKEIR